MRLNALLVDRLARDDPTLVRLSSSDGSLSAEGVEALAGALRANSTLVPEERPAERSGGCWRSVLLAQSF